MRLLLISLVLISLTSIAVPLRAEQGICELKRLNKEEAKEKGIHRSKLRYYVPDYCKKGDVIFHMGNTSKYTPSMRREDSMTVFFLANCEYDTFRTMLMRPPSKGFPMPYYSYHCIYRGAENILKVRGAEEESKRKIDE